MKRSSICSLVLVGAALSSGLFPDESSAASRPTETRPALKTTLAAAVDADCDGALWDETRSRASFTKRQEVLAGECVVFRITFSNEGDFPIRSLRISDPVPRFMSYVADSAVNVDTPSGLAPRTPLTPSAEGTGLVVWPFDGSLAPGDTGRVEFRARFRQ